MRMFRRWMIVLCLSLGLLVSACGQQSAPAKNAPASKADPAAKPAEAPKAPAAAKDVVKVPVAMGDRKAFIYLQPLLADSLGFLKDEGIEVEAKEYKGGSPVAKALASGEVEFAHMALDHVIRYGTEGDMVALLVYNRYPGLTIMVDAKYRGEITTMADLKGRKVGITTAGSGSHNILQNVVLKNGMNVNDIEYVPVGFDLDKAFAAGKVVAGYAYDPLTSKMIKEGKAYVLYDFRLETDTKKVLGGSYPVTALVTTRQVIKEKPELVQRMVNAMQNANQWLQTHTPAEVATRVPDDVRSDTALYTEALANSWASFHPDGAFDEELINTVIEGMKRTKSLPEAEKVEADKLFDNSFVKKALSVASSR